MSFSVSSFESRSPNSPIQNVLASVTVNDVEENGQSESVSSVDEALEILGRSVTGRNGEERRDLVSERRVVRVLHDRHPVEKKRRSQLQNDKRVGVTGRRTSGWCCIREP